MLHIALEKRADRGGGGVRKTALSDVTYKQVPAYQPAAIWFNTGTSCRAWRRQEDIGKAEHSFDQIMNIGTSDKATAITTTDTYQVATKLESMSGHAPNLWTGSTTYSGSTGTATIRGGVRGSIR
jgi:hypothetical protein